MSYHEEPVDGENKNEIKGDLDLDVFIKQSDDFSKIEMALKMVLKREINFLGKKLIISKKREGRVDDPDNVDVSIMRMVSKLEKILEGEIERWRLIEEKISSIYQMRDDLRIRINANIVNDLPEDKIEEEKIEEKKEEMEVENVSKAFIMVERSY